MRELFETAKPKPATERASGTRTDLRKQVDASYYGYNLDEDDGTLLAFEAQKEEEARQNLMADSGRTTPPGWEPLPGDIGDGQGWRLPTSEEVQEELVERRRRRLLDKLG